MESTELELHVRRRDTAYTVDACITSSSYDIVPAVDVPVQFDLNALQMLAFDPEAYGRQLTEAFFASGQMKAAWQQARTMARLGTLRLRLRLDQRDSELHALCWELIRDPLEDVPLALSKRVVLSRYLESDDVTPITVPELSIKRALVLVANPSDLPRFGLAPLDVEGEVASIRAGLGTIDTVILGGQAKPPARRATIAATVAALHDAPQIVVLIGHGTMMNGESYLWLEREDGTAERIRGTEIVQLMAQLDVRPLLVILVSCESGGRDCGDTLAALGPRLARIGVAAVLAFQGTIACATVRQLLPVLFREIQRDGQVDRALAAARATILQGHDWWRPVLMLRVRDGRLWHCPARLAESLPPANVDRRLLEPLESPIPSNARFYIERQPADRIALAAAQSRGGVTLTIKGRRQVGKTSLLVRVMEHAIRAGKRVVYLDFQQFTQQARADADTFFRQFASWLSDELKLGDELDAYWLPSLGNVHRCTRYLEQAVLPAVGAPILLAMDEVDSILDCSFRTDFFAMLRAWHSNRAMPNRSHWRQLDLTLVTSTEPYKLVENLNQSPFNVGEIIELKDFSAEQAAELSELHGRPLGPAQEQHLFTLLNGHPNLTRLALHLIADSRMSAADLFARAADDEGPFGEHLRRHGRFLSAHPELGQVLRQILHTQHCPDDRAFWRLHGAGLVYRDGGRVLARCQLYSLYFSEVLR